MAHNQHNPPPAVCPAPTDHPATSAEPEARQTIRVGGFEVGPDWPAPLSPNRFPLNLVRPPACGNVEVETNPQGGGVSSAPVKGDMACGNSSPPRGNLPFPHSRTRGPRALTVTVLLEHAQAQIAASEKAELWGLHVQARIVTLVSGQTSAGKTTFLHTLAYHLAEGREFLGIKPPRPLRMLYVDYESPLDVLVDHFTRIGTSANLHFMDPDCLPKGGTLLHALKTMVPGKFDVVIVDPLMVAYPVPDENDNAQASEQMERFREVARETQAGIVLVHNTGRKALEAGHDGPFDARGASARTDRADVALTLRTVDATRRLLEVVKSRRRNLGARIHFEFDGDLGYRLLSGNESQPTRGSARRDWLAQALHVVREEHAAGRAPVARKTIQDRLGIVGDSAEDRALTKALAEAVDTRQLTKAARGHYALPAEQPASDGQIGEGERRLDHEADERALREMGR